MFLGAEDGAAHSAVRDQQVAPRAEEVHLPARAEFGAEELPDVGGGPGKHHAVRRASDAVQAVKTGLAGLSIAAGTRRGWREAEIAGTVFLVLLLFARFFDWWWDFLPRWLFFLVIGALSVGMLLALRRLRSTRHEARA